MQDFRRGNQVLDFVAQYLDTPGLGCFVQCRHDGPVDVVALFESLVQFHLADQRAQGGLGQLGNCQHIITGAIAGTFGIGHEEIQDAVDLELGVVLGDADLAWHVERDFLETVAIGYAVNERNDDVQARRQDAVKTSQSFDDKGTLLRYHAQGAGNDNKGKDQQDSSGRQHGGHSSTARMIRVLPSSLTISK